MTSTDTAWGPHATRPPTGGRRAARRARERRRRLHRRVALGLAGLVVGVAALLATLLLAGQMTDPAVAPYAGADTAGAPPQQSLLLVQERGGGGSAVTATLLAASADGSGFVLFLPVGTLVDIPGVGLDRLGLALQYGGPELVQSTVENLLGVRVDHVAAVSDAGLAAWLDRVGSLEVDVPGRLVQRLDDGTAQVRFEPGSQPLDGQRLAELWAFRERGEEELDALPRQQRVLDALFTTAGASEAREALLAGGAPQLQTAAEEAWLGELFATFATARDEERLRFSVLPVEPFGGDGPGGGATYRLRDGETRELVGAHLAGSMPVGGGAEAVRVQVLNGIGVPGVGQMVDRRLERGAFRIVLSDNARSFDFERTQIIIYDEGERSLAAARRVQELLGVGTIQVSRQPQSVVDLTLVVGADFLAADPPSAEPPPAEEQEESDTGDA